MIPPFFGLFLSGPNAKHLTRGRVCFVMTGGSFEQHFLGWNHGLLVKARVGVSHNSRQSCLPSIHDFRFLPRRTFHPQAIPYPLRNLCGFASNKANKKKKASEREVQAVSNESRMAEVESKKKEPIRVSKNCFGVGEVRTITGESRHIPCVDPM